MSLRVSRLVTVALAISLMLMTTASKAEQSDPLAQQQMILDKQVEILSSVVSPELQAALAASQAAWVAHRDLSCAFQSKFAAEFSNSGAGRLEMQSAQCITQMNQQRLQELQGQLQRLMRYQSRNQQFDNIIQPLTVLPATPPATTPSAPVTPEDQGLLKASNYSVAGTMPNGRAYSGTCMITALGGGQYKFEWRAGGIYVGTGKLEGDMISVNWGSSAPAIYKVNADGTLSGTWANGRATEFLKPAS